MHGAPFPGALPALVPATPHACFCFALVTWTATFVCFVRRLFPGYLAGLLGQAETAVDSPGIARLLDTADQRGGRLLYTAFALGAS